MPTKAQIYFAVNDAIVEAEAKAGRPFHDFEYGSILDVCALCGKDLETGNHWNYSEDFSEDPDPEEKEEC